MELENQDKTFNTICRVCLSHGKSEKMVSLIDNSDENGLSAYGISFEKLTNLSVVQNYLPTKICHKCKKSLERVATFLITSEASDRKLAKLVKFSLNQELNEEMVKEVVHQYTLFNQNFPEDSGPGTNTACNTRSFMTFSEKDRQAKTSKDLLEVKVEVDLQQVSNDSDSDNYSADCTKKQHKNKTKTNTDNVDIFLYSIQKLLTTKIEDLQIESKKEIRKKDVKSKVTEQDLTCHICHRVLANQWTYKHHIERHGKCRYVCDQCGKGFPVLAELTQHQIYRHNIGSTLECDQCSFKAARRLELIEHIRLHTGERPFTCEKCGLTFRRKAIYKNHLKSHGEKTVPCDYCPRKFYRRSEMLAHANNIHDRMYVFLCKVCNVTYAMAKTVRRHMLVKHGIPRNMQGKVVRINKSSDSADTIFFKEGN